MASPTLTVTVSGEKAKSLISTGVAPCGAVVAGASATAVALLPESDATPRPNANAAAPMVTTAATITTMIGRPATPDLRIPPPFGSITGSAGDVLGGEAGPCQRQEQRDVHRLEGEAPSEVVPQDRVAEQVDEREPV